MHSNGKREPEEIIQRRVAGRSHLHALIVGYLALAIAGSVLIYMLFVDQAVRDLADAIRENTKVRNAR